MAESTQSEHPAECRNVWQKWAGFLDKELTPEESARVQKHLDECGTCRDYVETQSSFNRLVRKSLIEDAQKLDENLRVKVLSLLERKSYGALSEEEERANRASSRQAPVPHDHGHSHDHGEPGHVHDHAHGHDHSHGMSPATRAAMAVMLVLLVIAVYLVIQTRTKVELMQEEVTAVRKDLEDARKEGEAAREAAAKDRYYLQLERNALRELGERYDALQGKYDESVKTSEKLQRALNSLVAAGSAVMKKEEPGKPVAELEKKWKDMFPRIGDMPHKSGDMDPRIWDVTPIEGEDVLWVVFTKKGDPKTQFTLMTFTEKYMKQHYGELKSMAETVKDGMTVLAWPNAKDQKVYHALISTADLNTTRAQLEALK